jgi:4-hydroxy-tetrahydrodipicolinate synthase/2-dehydro-3-deoxy-phosphogluconate/2-dehydro-3-deoxy-6-phosphogalactonate aldolase
MEVFRGLFVATLTPFDAADRLNFAAVRRHVEFLIEGGVAGLCPAGTTGEMLYLSTGEKVRLIEEAIRAAGGRVPVIAGIWALREKEVALLARAAVSAGAAGVFLPPPIYYPADAETLFQWYARAAEAAGAPVFAYNIPSYAANAIPLEVVERLAAEGVIEGIKDSTGKAEQMHALVERFGDRITVMAASDGFVTEARNLGAHGFISALANVWPELLVRVWEGDEELQAALTGVRAVVKDAGGIPALKVLLTKRGHDFGGSRVPHVPITPEKASSLDLAAGVLRPVEVY